ncbi:magnesium/cobalt transporter CorA [Candidatus Woesearchaeota archaeon]|nr:magnesium/cobalt transporter CorA [Candidatus Woesearchaeota archaeon]
MLKVWQLVKSKKDVHLVSLEKADSSLLWIDCVKPTSTEFTSISKRTGIPISSLKKTTKTHQRPHIIVNSAHSHILFAGTVEENNSLKTTSISFYLTKGAIVTIHENPLSSFTTFAQLDPEEKALLFSHNSSYLLLHLLRKICNDFFTALEKVNAEIENLEEKVLENPSHQLSKKIFSIKRSLIFYERSLMPNKDVIISLENELFGHASHEERSLLSELANDVNELVYLASTYQDILTNVLDMYLNSISNNMNKIMKTLTIITAFVMIPTFIAGIFGMNFLMPIYTWKYGHFIVIGGMAFSILVSSIIFKRKKWL